MLWRFPELTRRHLEVLRGMIRYRWVAALQARALPDSIAALVQPQSRFPLDLVTDFIRITDDFSDLMDPVVFWLIGLGGRDRMQVGMTPAQHERFTELVEGAYDVLAAGSSPSAQAFIRDIQEAQVEIRAMLSEAPMADPEAAAAEGTPVFLRSGQNPGRLN